MNISIGKTKISLSFPFAAMVSLLMLTDRSGWWALGLSAALLHELGHLFGMAAFGMAPREIRLMFGGIQIFGLYPALPRQTVWFTLCGPGSNFAAFLVLLLIGYGFRQTELFRAAALHLVIGTVNMLPFRGLDGGNLLELALQRRLSPKATEKTFRAVTAAGVVGCVLFALFVCRTPAGILSALFFSLYIIVSLFLKL